MAISAEPTITSLSVSDAHRLAKLVPLLGSPEEGEATGALIRIRAMLTKTGTDFCAAIENPAYKESVWQAYGHPSWLEGHASSEKHRLECQRLERQCERLAAAVTELKEAGALCRACESKRRWLASVMGCATLWLWFHFVANGIHLSKTSLYGVMLGVFPISFVWCRWRWLKRKRRRRG